MSTKAKNELLPRIGKLLAIIVVVCVAIVLIYFLVLQFHLLASLHMVTIPEPNLFFSIIIPFLFYLIILHIFPVIVK